MVLWPSWGRWDPPHRLALEVAPVARLSHVVVDDDQIAAQAIALLKHHRAGRLTFLPPNRLRAPATPAPRPGRWFQGLVDRAVALVRFEPVYGQVFAHVLGETLVFETLNQARRLLGHHRCVTLEGELLERSGAMTDGSLQRRQDRLDFSHSEQAEEGDDAQVVSGQWRRLQEELKAAEARHTATLAQRETLRSAVRKHQLADQRLADQRQLLPREGEQLEREREVLTRRPRELAADRQQLETQGQAPGAATGSGGAAAGSTGGCRGAVQGQGHAPFGRHVQGRKVPDRPQLPVCPATLSSFPFLCSGRGGQLPGWRQRGEPGQVDCTAGPTGQVSRGESRRPMIAVAQRTIGVTQTRGAHIQVIGLPIQAAWLSSTSVPDLWNNGVMHR